MSVIIKDIEKPKSCYAVIDGESEYCPFVNTDDDCVLQLKKGICEGTWADQYSKCPLTEAPDPCDDAVSRKDCLKELSNMMDTDGFRDGLAVSRANVERMLKSIPTIQPEQRWIPCSERLPEVHESGNSFSGIYMQSNPVLVYGTCEYEDNAQFHVVTYCDDLDGNTYWSTELDAFTVSGVIAWMPLPEPYGGD